MGIFAKLPHFIGQCMGNDIKASIFIVAVYSAHIGNIVFDGSQCNQRIMTKPAVQNFFCFCWEKFF